MQTQKFARRVRALLMAGAVAGVTAGAIAAPALADEDWHGHDGWQHQEWHGQAWRGDDDDWRPPAYYGYGYYAAPYGYTYAAPAPVYAAPPSIDFVFPVHIR